MAYGKFLGLVLVTCLPVTALAQEGTNSQTLDGQVQRMQQGQPAVPGAWNASVSGTGRTMSVIGSEGSGAIPALPLQVLQSSNGVIYITGGVGDEEEAQLRATGREYNTHLLFTATHGAYLSDVTVRVRDSGGTEIFAAEGVGPYLYAKLPPGAYNIEVTSQAGGTQSFPLTVRSGGVASHHSRFNVSV